MSKVLFTWDVPEALRRRLRERLDDVALTLVFPDVDADEVPADDRGGSGDGAAEPRPEVLRALARDADVLVGWRYDAALLDAAERCRLCVNPGAGVQHLSELFQREGAPILVNSHGNASLTAQGTVALLLALAHRVPFHDRRFRGGHWQDDLVARSHPARPLRGRRLGLMGYGHVARATRELLAGWRMEVHALRTAWPEGAPPGVTAHTTLETFLPRAEVLVVALPLTRATEGLLDREALSRLPAGALLVNVGRGSVVDQAALWEALETGQLGGAGLDVWWEYTPVADDAGRRYPSARPFHERDDVVCSPHRAAGPFDDLDRWDDVAANLRRFAEGAPLANVVDPARGY